MWARKPSRAALAVAGLLLPLLASACSPVIPRPRPVVMTSGTRLAADADRMIEIHDWVLAQLETITCRQTINRRPDPTPVIRPDGRPDFDRLPHLTPELRHLAAL